jgi:hypothetical protein
MRCFSLVPLTNNVHLTNNVRVYVSITNMSVCMCVSP